MKTLPDLGRASNGGARASLPFLRALSCRLTPLVGLPSESPIKILETTTDGDNGAFVVSFCGDAVYTMPLPKPPKQLVQTRSTVTFSCIDALVYTS